MNREEPHVIQVRKVITCKSLIINSNNAVLFIFCLVPAAAGKVICSFQNIANGNVITCAWDIGDHKHMYQVLVIGTLTSKIQ